MGEQLGFGRPAIILGIEIMEIIRDAFPDKEGPNKEGKRAGNSPPARIALKSIGAFQIPGLCLLHEHTLHMVSFNGSHLKDICPAAKIAHIELY